MYDDTPSESNHEVAHGDITNPAMEARALQFIRTGRPKNKPFFLFMYVWDPHYDYIPPPPYDSAFVPPGAQFYVIARPSAISSLEEGKSVLAAMGPWGAPTTSWLRDT